EMTSYQLYSLPMMELQIVKRTNVYTLMDGISLVVNNSLHGMSNFLHLFIIRLYMFSSSLASFLISLLILWLPYSLRLSLSSVLPSYFGKNFARSELPNN